MTSTDRQEQILRYQSIVKDIETNNCTAEEIYNRLGISISAGQSNDFPLSNMLSAVCGILVIKGEPPKTDIITDPDNLEHSSPKCNDDTITDPDILEHGNPNCNDDTITDSEILEHGSPAKQLRIDTKTRDVCDDDPDMKPFPKTNFIIKIDGETLNVNKTVLIKHSALIREMSEDGCFDEGHPQELEVQPPDDTEITYDQVVEFLNCIYPGFRQPVSFSNMLQVLPAAEYFEAEDLKMSCETAIEEYINSVLDENPVSNIPGIVEYLIICDRYSLLNSLNNVTNTASKVPLKWLMAVESFAFVSDKVKNKLLTPDQRQTLLDAEKKGLKLQAEDLIIDDKNTFYC